MTWNIRHNGMSFSSDDFLIEDLAEIESATGVPWSVANPLREIKVAKAFLAAAMLRSGRSDVEVETALKMLTLKHLKKAFAFVVDEDDEGETDAEPDPSVPPPSPITPGSSTGVPAKDGRRLKSASRGSATA